MINKIYKGGMRCDFCGDHFISKDDQLSIKKRNICCYCFRAQNHDMDQENMKMFEEAKKYDRIAGIIKKSRLIDPNKVVQRRIYARLIKKAYPPSSDFT